MAPRPCRSKINAEMSPDAYLLVVGEWSRQPPLQSLRDKLGTVLIKGCLFLKTFFSNECPQTNNKYYYFQEDIIFKSHHRLPAVHTSDIAVNIGLDPHVGAGWLPCGCPVDGTIRCGFGEDSGGGSDFGGQREHE